MLNNIQLEIMVAIVGLVITAAIIYHLVVHCKIFEQKVRLQEELVNVYTPDILNGKVDKEPELKSVQTTEEVVS